MVFAQVDVFEAMDIAVLSALSSALASADCSERDQVIGVSPSDDPRRVAGKRLQDLCGVSRARAILGGLHLGFVHQLPGEDRRVVSVTGGDFAGPPEI